MTSPQSAIAHETAPAAIPAKFVIANWKMHGSLAENQALIAGYLSKLSTLSDTRVVVCPPYPYLAQMQSLLAGSDIAWGAQNMAKKSVGAYTGEVSAAMLQDFGCQYVILGHSERSTAYCESDDNIADKFMLAKESGLTPILCVGETLIEREAGVMERVVGEQLDVILQKYGAELLSHTIVSYEPIWAIGTGLAASPEQAKAMHQFIFEKLNHASNGQMKGLKILYGGSVNPQNAVQLFAEPEIDGGLIGGCSLNAEDFTKICQAAEQSCIDASVSV